MAKTYMKPRIEYMLIDHQVRIDVKAKITMMINLLYKKLTAINP